MSHTIDRYDDANFTILREQMMEVTARETSLLDFAHFRSRNKCIVYAFTLS